MRSINQPKLIRLPLYSLSDAVKSPTTGKFTIVMEPTYIASQTIFENSAALVDHGWHSIHSSFHVSIPHQQPPQCQTLANTFSSPHRQFPSATRLLTVNDERAPRYRVKVKSSSEKNLSYNHSGTANNGRSQRSKVTAAKVGWRATSSTRGTVMQ
jgi:hypothetical protein